MKKIVTLAALTCILSMAVHAQDMFDAMKTNRLDIKGSARYTSMGGAFVSLGGDASALKDNPAGLGVFRSSEVSFSLNYDYVRTHAHWNQSGNIAEIHPFTMNQAELVLNLSSTDKQKGLLAHNFAFGYNRVVNFRRSMFARSGTSQEASLTDNMSAYSNRNNQPLSPDVFFEENDTYNNSSVGWLSVLGYDAGLMAYDSTSTSAPWYSTLEIGEQVMPSQKLIENGYIDQYKFAWGCNINNQFYVGVGVNLLSMEYRLSSVYGETFLGSRGGGFSLDSYVSTSGVGVNANVGIIARPVSFLRLGASIQTPTAWTMNDRSKGELSAGKEYSTPEWLQDYQLRTPFKVNAGGSVVLGKAGLVSVEYEYNNTRSTRLTGADGDATGFAIINQDARDMFKDVHRVKVGTEWWVIPNLAVRAGYVYQTALTKMDACRSVMTNTTRTDMQYSIEGATQYASAGLGYRTKAFFIDLAYQYKWTNENLYTFENLSAGALSPIDLSTSRHSVVMSVGFKF